MEILRIRLLGGFELERGGAILSPPPTPKSRSLLAYLILNRDRLTHRETLCATLWPDETEAVARKALRSAIWRIRSALDGHGESAPDDDSDPYIYRDAYQVGFRGAAPVWVDVWDFEDVLAAIDAKVDGALDGADGQAMARAAMLYHGYYAAAVYDDWITAEQSRLQHAHLALVERIAVFHANNQRWLQAVLWAERALACDPLREHVHRIVMGCHMSMGDRPSALRQYARCEAVLRSELGIEPMAETKALRDQVHGPALDGSPGPQPGRWAARRNGGRDARLASEVDAALSTLRRITRRLDDARGGRHGNRVAPTR